MKMILRNLLHQLFDILFRLHFQFITPKRLLLIDRLQFIMKNIICKYRTYFINALLRQKSLLRICGINNQMYMRMMRGIVKCAVPFQIAQRNYRLLRNVSNVPHDKLTPTVRVIIAQTNRIFTA